MIADHDVNRIAFVTIPMGVSAEVREGQTVECGETGELVCFWSTPIVPDSLNSHHFLIRARGAGTRIMHGSRGEMYVRTGITFELEIETNLV